MLPKLQIQSYSWIDGFIKFLRIPIFDSVKSELYKRKFRNSSTKKDFEIDNLNIVVIELKVKIRRKKLWKLINKMINWEIY